MTPVTLVTRPKVSDNIRADVVALLKDALDKAETGEIESVVILMTRPGGGWQERRSGTISMTATIGQLEIIKQGWINEYLSKEDET